MQPQQSSGLQNSERQYLTAGRPGAAGFFAVFALLAAGLKLGWWDSLDQAAAEAMPSIHTAWLIHLFEAPSILGSTAGFAALFILAAGYWSYRKRYADALSLLLAIGGSYALNSLLKAWIGRERPALPHLTEADGFGFPSGNAMVSMAFYGMIAYLLALEAGEKKRKLIYWCAGLILLIIGFSRIYLNVHYPTDILAGYAAGAGWLMICRIVHTRFQRKRN